MQWYDNPGTRLPEAFNDRDLQFSVQESCARIRRKQQKIRFRETVQRGKEGNEETYIDSTVSTVRDIYLISGRHQDVRR